MTQKGTWSAALIVHKDISRIAVYFDNKPDLIARIKKLNGIKWSRTLRVWHLPDNVTYRKMFRLATEDSIKINPLNKNELEATIELLQLKAYSPKTIKTYTSELSQFLAYIGQNEAQNIDAKAIKAYLVHCISTLKLTEATIHSRMNALKFYYIQVLKKEDLFFDIPRPKKRTENPHFFNMEEVASIINSTKNLKHKTMLMLSYSAGLRVSEVVTLKTSNIDSKRMQINIVQAKGKKDRMVALSPLLLIMLRNYYLAYRPQKNGYLFEGAEINTPYSTRSLQLVLKSAKEKAGILKPGSIHALRHSFATHLLDRGTDIHMIMKLLGHNDLKTTLRYLHVTNRDMLNIISPLDNLQLDIL